MVESLKEALDTCSDANVIKNELYRHRLREQNRDENIKRHIEILLDKYLKTFMAANTHHFRISSTTQTQPKLTILQQKLDNFQND